jgi:hypothetical protein
MRHATPLFALRYRFHRCQAGSWYCWRRAVVEWPLPACIHHVDNDLMQFGRSLWQAFRLDSPPEHR